MGVKTAGLLSIYVDGVLRGTKDHSLGSTDKAIPLSLGNRPGSSDRAFAGALDEVRVYNRELTSGEVASMFWNAERVYVNGGYEVDTASGEKTISYFHGAQLVAVKEAGTLEYLHQDHLGSSSVTTDSTGASPARVAYFPYGADRSAAGVLPTERRYTGQRFDNSVDLYFYNARYYDSALGRFISADTWTQPVTASASRALHMRRYMPLITTITEGDTWSIILPSIGKLGTTTARMSNGREQRPRDTNGSSR
ncbi:MAG: hypothetical protein O3B84_04125 [Chloroflexi bacterium]|nr:hypothetical protein [Chloroflexota bacterium]